jgi:DNA-binding NtrC family response regulator
MSLVCLKSTVLNGHPLDVPRPLKDQSVIRLGQTLLVYHDDLLSLRDDASLPSFGMAGQYYTRQLISEIHDATSTTRGGILLAGPTGTGKELAARAYASMLNREILVQSAVRYATEDEASSSLFGVKAKTFSDVEARDGYIEQADGGVLFLDEAHLLPVRIQKLLLRILEDGVLARIGESTTKTVDVRFVLASNEPGPELGLAHDLLARLRVIHLEPLQRRVADIPGLFISLLSSALKKLGHSELPTVYLVSVVDHELMMTDGFKKDNIRGLIDIADRIATRIDKGAAHETAIAEGLKVLFEPGRGPLPVYDEEVVVPLTEGPGSIQQIVVNAYHRHSGNVSAIERELLKKNVHISRRRIAAILDSLGLKRTRKLIGVCRSRASTAA